MLNKFQINKYINFYQLMTHFYDEHDFEHTYCNIWTVRKYWSDDPILLCTICSGDAYSDFTFDIELNVFRCSTAKKEGTIIEFVACIIRCTEEEAVIWVNEAIKRDDQPK